MKRIASKTIARANRRTGFSLVEVLLAIFILGIGMIMVASVFPVGANWTRQTTEESVAQSVAADALTVIQTYYGPGGACANTPAYALTPNNLQQDLTTGIAPIFNYGTAFALQALPGFTNIPAAQRAYQFGSTNPFPAQNLAACTYFWTALVRLSPGVPLDYQATNPIWTSTYKYDIFILVFRKGATEHQFSPNLPAYGTEVVNTRDTVTKPAEILIPAIYRHAWDKGQYVPNATPTIQNAYPPIGGIGIGAWSGTVFTQRTSSIGGTAWPRPALLGQSYDPVSGGSSINPEPIIWSPPADNTQVSPLIYVYQTTLTM